MFTSRTGPAADRNDRLSRARRQVWWTNREAGLAVLLVAALASPIRAQGRVTVLRAEIGSSEMHDGNSGASGGLYVGRSLDDRDRVRLQLGAFGGPAYAALDLGLELRLRAGPVNLFVGGGAGLLGEEDYGGAFVRAGGGADIALSERVTARATAQAGTHDGQSGPHLIAVGIEYRFLGRKR